MKPLLKYFFALTVTVYLLNTIGVPVYYHYCGGELESVTAMFKGESCCGDEQDEDMGCCQNETKIISQKSETALNGQHYKLNPSVIDNHLFNTTLNFKQPLSSFGFSNHFLFNIHLPESGRTVLTSKSVLII